LETGERTSASAGRGEKRATATRIDFGSGKDMRKAPSARKGGAAPGQLDLFAT
jgi:hypothetical protein